MRDFSQPTAHRVSAHPGPASRRARRSHRARSRPAHRPAHRARPGPIWVWPASSAQRGGSPPRRPAPSQTATARQSQCRGAATDGCARGRARSSTRMRVQPGRSSRRARTAASAGALVSMHTAGGFAGTCFGKHGCLAKGARRGNKWGAHQELQVLWHSITRRAPALGVVLHLRNRERSHARLPSCSCDEAKLSCSRPARISHNIFDFGTRFHWVFRRDRSCSCCVLVPCGGPGPKWQPRQQCRPILWHPEERRGRRPRHAGCRRRRAACRGCVG